MDMYTLVAHRYAEGVAAQIRHQSTGTPRRRNVRRGHSATTQRPGRSAMASDPSR
jgi:hypothetical protein